MVIFYAFKNICCSNIKHHSLENVIIVLYHRGMKTDKYLLFTDLDGTLLDHNTYDFSEAKEALELLRLRKIPIIIATSKTFAEVVEYEKKLGIKHPFIVENGAGIFVPKECEVLSGLSSTKEWVKISKAKSYKQLRKLFVKLKEKYKMKGFADMDVSEVMKLTGLSVDDAYKAMQRDFSEPFVLYDESELLLLQEELRNQGFDVVKGGRFYHMISQGVDKASAVESLIKVYQDYHELKCHSIALGDSGNDFTMLESVDTGVLIPRCDGSFAPLHNSKVHRAKYPGPKGWSSFVMEFFDGD